MKRIFLLSMALTGCFDDSGGALGGDGDGSSTESENDDAGTNAPTDDGGDGGGGDGGSSSKTGESSNEGSSDGGTETTEGASTSTDNSTTTNDSDSTGGSETADGIPLDGICDPLDPANPCANGLTCWPWKWDAFNNYYQFFCQEYTGEANGGEYGDIAMDQFSCKSGFAPLNNLNGDKFPPGICGGMGTCCTALCSSEYPNCPSNTQCNLGVEPMNMNFYDAETYGTCAS